MQYIIAKILFSDHVVHFEDAEASHDRGDRRRRRRRRQTAKDDAE